MASDKNKTTENTPFDYEPAECFDKVKTRGRPKLILNAVGQRVVETLGAVMATEQDGTYKKGNAVFPFTSGELLDERLDEAKVVFFSGEKAYKPLTEFLVEFNANGTIR